jgi:hypothetical protein
MEKPQGFASIGEAVTGMLSATLRLMPSRNEPAFCKLSRYPSGFQLEVSQLNGPWFSVQLVKFREDSLNAEDLVPLTVGDDSLRTAIRKVVANLEHARPATLVVRGAVADTLPPWYCAAFHVEGLRSRTARMVADERELFVFLDATGCDTLLTERGEALISGPDETFRLEPAWVDVTGQDPAAKKVETTSTVKGLFQRYMRYRRALSGTVSETLVAIGSSSDAQWHAQASYETIESLANERKLSIPELAREAGVAFRDIKRLQDFELAAPELVVKLASALRVAPNRLLADRETNLGFAASNGGEFMKMVSGAMAYRRLEGQSLRTGDLDEARRLLELAQDVSEVAAFELSEFAGAKVDAPTNESDARYEVMAQELLDDAKACGIKLIFSREVQFVQTGSATVKDGGSMPMNVLTICAERIDGAIPAIWTAIK